MAKSTDEQNNKEFKVKLSEKQLKIISNKFPSIKEEAIINTAIEEFFDFLENQKRFSKFSVFQEYRLFLLIKNIYKDNFITEPIVRRIFKIDSSPAKKMINDVKIDYEEELQTFNSKSMKSFLDNIGDENKNGLITFTCESQCMIDSMNAIIQEKNPSAKKIYKEKGSLCTYKIYVDEYKLLKDAL